MNFPTVYTVITDGYAIQPIDGSESDRADSGKHRVRRLWAIEQYSITFRIAGLLVVNVAAVQQFYQSYKNQLITWTDPYTGIAYSVIMMREPAVKEVNGIYSTMEVTMEGTKS